MKKAALLIFSVGFIAGGFYLFTPSADLSTPDSSMATLSFRRSSHTMSEHTVADTEPAVAQPGNEFHRHLENLWAAMQEGHEADVADALKNLTEFLENHPEQMKEALDLLKSEMDDGKLSPLTQAIAQCHGTEGRLLINQAALKLIRAGMPSRRQMGLELLGKSAPVEDELVQSILGVAQQDSDRQIRLTAIDTLSFWLTQNSVSAEKLLPSLLQISQSSNDETVRGRVLQILAQQPGELPDAAFPIAARSLTAENTDIRIAALTILGGATGEMKIFAQKNLEAAYGKEPNEEVRKNMLTQIVRLGQEQASEILQRLSQNENSSLRQDMEDYLQLIAEGKTASVDEIYSQKFLLEAERVTVGLP